MDQNFIDFFLNEQIQVNFKVFIIGLITSGILSFLIQLVYLKYSNSYSNKFDFSKNFIILGLATTLVITIVKSSLALSLGLVGALSIVRFRAAIKDPEELVYLFLVIATGLGCGAGQIKITLIGILASLLIIIIYSKFWKKRKFTRGEVLNSSLVFSRQVLKSDIDKIINKLSPLCEEIEFISFSSTSSSTTVNLDIIPINFLKIAEIEEQIRQVDKEVKIIIAKDNLLSL